MSARVLVACEYSGIVRDAFRRRGFHAMSCDLLPTEAPGPHYEGDVRDVLGDGWDLMVAHPTCTYLTNSGVRWLHERDGRWALMEEGADFLRSLLDAPIPRIAVENPVPHRYAVERIGRRYDQAFQPWEFGHPETKRTCLWLKNLPPLLPTAIAQTAEARVHRMAPGPNRQKERSRFFPAVADAMADQWGPFLVADRRAA
jgi:hypothetical protein